MAEEHFPRTLELIRQGMAQGLHPGSQIYISKMGEIRLDIAMGECRPGVAMTTGSINLWMSSVKPVAAVAIAQLWERELLELDDRVSLHIPEFGKRGKEQITIRHLLTHMGGFRAVIGLEWGTPFDQAIAMICDAPLEPRWIPGRTAGYHAASSWYILAELVRRLDGRGYDRYVREAIFLPAGMNDCWIGMPREDYRRYGEQIGFLYDTSKGEPKPASPGNNEEDASAIRPGANGRGPMRELGRFYESLLRDRDSPLLRPQTIEAITARHRTGVRDLTFKHVVDWGLGFLVNSNQYGPQTVPYGYGPHAGPRVFGHSGQESSCAFCDPEHELVVAWICNGLPGEVPHSVRQRAINRAIYEDMGLNGFE